jgi:hypothetical protein
MTEARNIGNLLFTGGLMEPKDKAKMGSRAANPKRPNRHRPRSPNRIAQPARPISSGRAPLA